jgi:hypothetical protein
MPIIKCVNHKTKKEIPEEVKSFFSQMLIEHIEQLGKGQFIDRLNISVSMHRTEAIIETSSMDFKYDPEKGLGQFC